MAAEAPPSERVRAESRAPAARGVAPEGGELWGHYIGVGSGAVAPGELAVRLREVAADRRAVSSVPKPGEPGSQTVVGVSGQYTWMAGELLQDELRRADDIRRKVYGGTEKRSFAPQFSEGRADRGDWRGMTPYRPLPAPGVRTAPEDIQRDVAQMHRDASRMPLRHNWSKPASRTRLLGRMLLSWGQSGVETGRSGPSLTLLPGRCGRPLLPLAHLMMEVGCPLVQLGGSAVVVFVVAVRAP